MSIHVNSAKIYFSFGLGFNKNIQDGLRWGFGGVYSGVQPWRDYQQSGSILDGRNCGFEVSYCNV